MHDSLIENNLLLQNFLTADSHSQEFFNRAITKAQNVLLSSFSSSELCYGGLPPKAMKEFFDTVETLPFSGKELAVVLDWVGENILQNSINISNPKTMGHLHCPPLIPALSAEVLISAANQSMDSWDQAPTASYLEQKIITDLLRCFELTTGDGVFTSGGTQSNLVGLLLALNIYSQNVLKWNCQKSGLPPQAAKFRILCSDLAHFSVTKSASLLGLGSDAIVSIPTNKYQQMSPTHLAMTINRLGEDNLLPIAVVATAGTTDFGSIDPMDEIAEILSSAQNIWLHVDAAYGGALIFSEKYAPLLKGIKYADSITIDFHKLFYQPISCSAVLVRNKTVLDVIKYNADYLNPEEDEEYGMLDLVGKSIQTTRRFDALKFFISMQTIGTGKFAAMIESVLSLTQDVASFIIQDKELELAAKPVITCVLFRYTSQGVAQLVLDEVNLEARNQILFSGIAVMGKTKINGKTFIKLTLLHPMSNLQEIIQVLEKFKNCAAELLNNKRNYKNIYTKSS
jgi:L-2,4-diaminobutyrate decarboxylase